MAPGGLDLLVDAVQSCFPAGTPADAGSLLTNARQESAVRRSLETVRRALSALDSGLTPDAVLTDAEEALESIGELTGRTQGGDRRRGVQPFLRGKITIFVFPCLSSCFP